MSNDTDTLQEKLQHAYHTMLESIEKILEKEGKDIREAFYKAEDKLGEWEQLSKDEVRKVSDEVKRDLTALGETFVGAKAAFREQVELDKRYLAEATWNTLSRIADKSTVQLIQLKAELEENVREITQGEHAVKHNAHQHWHSEHALWLDDIEHWENSHKDAIAKLDAIKYRLDQQVLALEEHKQSILSHEAIIKNHEHTLAGTERDPSNQRLREQDDLDNILHLEEKVLHKQQAEFHTDIKHYQQKIMDLINMINQKTQQFDG